MHFAGDNAEDQPKSREEAEQDEEEASRPVPVSASKVKKERTPLASKTASKQSTAIYDSQIHQYNTENDNISIRKRKPIRSVDVSDLNALHAASVPDGKGPDSGGKTNGKALQDSAVLKNKLLALMMSLFRGHDLKLEQIDALSKEEKYILSSLVLRKFNIKMNPVAANPTILTSINSQRQLSKNKRLEENYKLVFKKALKYLLRKFKKYNEVKGKKNDLEQQFYKFYFEEVFKSEGIEVEMGIDPESNTFKGQNLFNPKTINSRYVTNIMKSGLFKAHFEDFLENQFVTDYNKSREFKIQKVVEKCYECFNKKKGGGYEEVQKYIEQNPKCKLPWSDTELVSAKESVKQLLANKLKKTDITESAAN
jgi:hypothetical protein